MHINHDTIHVVACRPSQWCNT